MIAKKSAKAVPGRSELAPPESLIRVGHYYQAAGCDPLSDIIPPGAERIELVTGGRGWLSIGREWVEVTPGALVWNIEGDRTIARSDWENPYRCLAVDIRTALPPRRGMRRAPRLAWWRDEEEVGRFTSEAVRRGVDDRVDRPSLLACVYGRLLFQSRLWAATREQEELPEPLRHAIALLEKGGSARPPRLGEVAKRVGWSLPYLHESFRLHLRTTPHEVALRRRMQSARERLAATDHPIKRIAADCGFGSAAAFCYAFRKRVGVTPLRYRRMETSALSG